MAYAKYSTTEEFIQKAEHIHGKVYDYSRVSYIDAKTKVELVCKVHGSFWQQPANHLNCRSGCPSCSKAGYKHHIPSILYVLTNGEVVKIGVTNRSAEERAKKISRSAGTTFKVAAKFHYDNGSEPLRIEQEMLKELRAMYAQPKAVYDGSTESFIGADLSTVLHKIQNRILNNENQQSYQKGKS